MYQLKVMLNDIVDQAFTDDPKLKSYKAFYIEVLDKDYKGRNGDYNPNTRHIRLMNTYRDEKKLVVTAIHELAHHINHIQGNTDVHGKGFYANYKKLLYSALDMKLFDKNEYISLVKENRDSQSEYKVIRMIQDYIPKDVEYKKNKFKIIIFGGYDIKETLKQRGYKFNKIGKAWELEVDETEKEKEESWVMGNSLKYKISEANQYIVKAEDAVRKKVHYIIFQVYNSYSVKDKLKVLGMDYISSLKVWEIRYKCDNDNREEIKELKNSLGALHIPFVSKKKDISGLCCYVFYE